MSKSRIQRPDRESNLPLARIGKISVGEKRPGQSGERPVSLDYFKATGNYASKFHDVYGEKPEVIKVIFISDDPEHSCKEEYDGRDSQGRRAGYGDGSIWFLWKGKGYEQAINKEEVSEYTKKHSIKWSAILTLHFIIPAIHGVLGLWKFQTKGDKSSIPQIRDTFDKIQDLAGTVINIPFDLIVKKVKSQNPGSTSVFPVVSLVPNLSQESMEVLKGYLQGGGSIGQLGLLSESKLASMRQLEAKTGDSSGKSNNVQQDGEFTAYTEIKE